jgi:hypothetical protein
VGLVGLFWFWLCNCINVCVYVSFGLDLYATRGREIGKIGRDMGCV